MVLIFADDIYGSRPRTLCFIGTGGKHNSRPFYASSPSVLLDALIFSSIFRFLAIFGFKYSRLPSGFVADRREVSQRPATLPQAGLLPREQEYVHRRTNDGWEDDLPFGMTDSGKNVQRVVMNTLERVWAGACLRI